MKSIIAKLMIVGLLAGTLLAFCPVVMPMINQALSLPVVKQPKPVLPPPGVKYLEKVEDLVFERTNQLRRAKGVAPLSQDDELRDVARAYSNDMLVRRFFDHTTPDGVSFHERISSNYHHWVRSIGENIWSAWGYKTSNAQSLAKEIVDDWLSSPGHRAILLDPDFTHLGVGVSARNGTILATQEFVGRSKIFSLGELITPWLIKFNKV
ncbi:MAG: CAP domain-containing protein [Desulfobaccales bacterium]